MTHRFVSVAEEELVEGWIGSPNETRICHNDFSMILNPQSPALRCSQTVGSEFQTIIGGFYFGGSATPSSTASMAMKLSFQWSFIKPGTLR